MGNAHEKKAALLELRKRLRRRLKSLEAKPKEEKPKEEKPAPKVLVAAAEED